MLPGDQFEYALYHGRSNKAQQLTRKREPKVQWTTIKARRVKTAETLMT